MSLFASLFGPTSSDTAEKDRQDALNAFNSITTPALSALQVQLQKYVTAGQLTPEQAETQLLSSNAFNQIATDPAYVGAQKQALQQLQSVATQGGLTAVDRSQLNDINNAQNQQNQSQNAATMQQAQQRGVGGSQLNQVNQLVNEQGAADRAANSGVQVAANAQQRALQAMQAAGQAGGALESQQYGEQANKAQAQNAIDLYNNQALNQTNLYNTQTSNAAQAANLANQQAINNANTQTANSQNEYNAAQNQTLYNDQLQKAQDLANTDLSNANAAQSAQNQDTAGTIGLVNAGVKAVGSAYGPITSALSSGATTAAMPSTSPTNESDAIGSYGNPNAPTNENQLPGFAHGGEVTDPEHPDHMSMGGHVHCYSHGGEAYHHPECMAKGGFLSGLKKGALHRDLGVPQGEKIPAKKVEKATHSDNETLRKRAQFAENAKHWNHKYEGGKVETIDQDNKHYTFTPGENGSLTAPAPQEPAAIPDQNKAPVAKTVGPSQTFIEKLGNLLGSHADQANDVENHSKGGKIKDFRAGGPVPGKAKVAGDSPKNDTVDAKLSPGEIVIPRSAANDEDEFKAFMAKFEPKKKMAAGGMIPLGIPRVNETNPMRDTARSPIGNPVPLAATNDANAFTHLMNAYKPKKVPKFDIGGPVPPAAPMSPPMAPPAADPGMPPMNPAPAAPMPPLNHPKKPKMPALKIPPEARALANLHQRVSNLEGRKI